MRIAAQMKGGYYPAPEIAVSHAARFLSPPRDKCYTLLDPCGGEGAAIQQLVEILKCPWEKTFIIEIDDSRAEILRTNLPEANILAPASFFGCRATPNSFSCTWLNPPFDDGYGGGRVEDEFLHTASSWLMPGGVLALVCPEEIVDEYSSARRHLTTYYEKCRIEPFPGDCRRFNEVIVLAHKRAKPQVDQTGSAKTSWAKIQAPEDFIYHIPPGPGPKVFQKTEPTESELQRMLARSPLRSHLTVSPQVPLPSPPLALGIGHVALLLASGHLDGVVYPEGKPPHVVRGTARKREYISDVAEVTNSDGSTSTRTTISERIELVVRTVDLTGQIQTFKETPEE